MILRDEVKHVSQSSSIHSVAEQSREGKARTWSSYLHTRHHQIGTIHHGVHQASGNWCCKKVVGFSEVWMVRHGGCSREYSAKHSLGGR